MVRLKPMIRRSLAPSWATTTGHAGSGRRKHQKSLTWGSFCAGLVLSNVLVIGVALVALGAVVKFHRRLVVRIRVRPRFVANDAAAVRPEALLRSVEKRVHELVLGEHEANIITSSSVDCMQLLEDNRNGLLSSGDPNGSTKFPTGKVFPANRLEQSFRISLTDQGDDWLAKSIRHGNEQQLHERHTLERIWRKLLDAPSPGTQELGDAEHAQPASVIVDVNAGSGYYSLMSVAASSKRESSVKVYAFEANPLQNLRTCESLEANEWGDRISLYSVGVGNRNVRDSPDGIPRTRPLAGSFDDRKVHATARIAEAAHVTKPVIALDAWAESKGLITGTDELQQNGPPTPSIIILRIGSTANLLQVLQGAERLLSRKAVVNLFCEISARSNLDSALSVRAVSAVLAAGYRLAGYGDVAVGPGENVLWKHDDRLVGNLVDAAQRRSPDKALSLWFLLPAAQQQRNGVYVSEDIRKSGDADRSGPLIPLKCTSFVSDALSGRLGFEDPNLGMDRDFMEQHVNHTSPSFWISLHNRDFDHPRWGIKTTGKYYKTQLENLWRMILSDAANRGSHVIDVGSNIGYFTLLSLAMGDFVVHAFEPNSVNFLRLCESLQLNGWTSAMAGPTTPRLLAYDAGVSDREDVLPFQANGKNPGASQFLDATAPNFQYEAYVKKPVISLDSYAQRQGWLEAPTAASQSASPPSPPKIAVLKIDVEGMEHRVLSGSAKLLRSHIVENVFLELSVKDMQESLNSNIALSTLVSAGYELAGIGNWAGPGQPVPWKADDNNLISRVLDEAEREDSKQLHVWFKVKRAEPQDLIRASHSGSDAIDR